MACEVRSPLLRLRREPAPFAGGAPAGRGDMPNIIVDRMKFANRSALRVAGVGRGMDPVKALKQVAFHLERAGAPTYRVQAFRNAAAVLGELAPAEVVTR